MTLIINNRDVARPLTMEDTIAALEGAYLALAEAVCPPAHRYPHSDQRSGQELPVGAQWRAARRRVISRSR